MDGTEVPWKIRDFSLIDQDSNVVGLKDFDDKIIVANFFYATCPKVCPKMNEELQLVAYKLTKQEDVVFLSHSVNPEADSVPVMKEYAARYNFPTSKWKFLTGEKKEIYDLAQSYYRVVNVKVDGPDEFIHSTVVALIDKDRHVRGYFESMNNPTFFRDLTGAIQALRKEYHLQNEQR